MPVSLAQAVATVEALVPLERYLDEEGLVGDCLPQGVLETVAPLGPGERLMAQCPFHDDTMRQFELRGGAPSRWRCHVCDEGGTIVALVKRQQGLSDWGALAFLDERYRLGLDLPRGLKAGHRLDTQARQARYARARLSPLAM